MENRPPDNSVILVTIVLVGGIIGVIAMVKWLFDRLMFNTSHSSKDDNNSSKSHIKSSQSRPTSPWVWISLVLIVTAMFWSYEPAQKRAAGRRQTGPISGWVCLGVV